MPTEAEFLRQVIQLARRYGWLTFHARAARTAKGWRTPVQGDGAGFPDLIMVRGEEVMAAELKVGRNKETVAQKKWIDALRGAFVTTYLWRPEDWGLIERVLT